MNLEIRLRRLEQLCKYRRKHVHCQAFVLSIRVIRTLQTLVIVSKNDFFFYQDEGADLPFAPPLRNELYLVPSGVRPVLQRTAIEVSK